MMNSARTEIQKRCIQCRAPKKLVALRDVSFGFGEEDQLLVCEKCLGLAVQKIMDASDLEFMVDELLSPLENCENDYNLKARVFHYLRSGSLLD